ncbi:MAG TPA: hypothetical protein VLD59_08135 [Steroidobacteraceae bacterium]|nr:hypothetical protein [Steroidobacteraceae bacterium]
MNLKPQQIRQGDVQLQPVASLPDGCKEVPNDKGRIVLAYGEVTGHSHAIADHNIDVENALDRELASKLTDAAIKRAATKAKATLWLAANGERFLEVKEAVTLRHEEHTAHTLNPGIYKLPVQVEYTPAELRRVAD